MISEWRGVNLQSVGCVQSRSFDSVGLEITSMATECLAKERIHLFQSLRVIKRDEGL